MTWTAVPVYLDSLALLAEPLLVKALLRMEKTYLSLI